VPFIVLKGAALAEGVYPDPRLRHSHDLDLLLEDGDIEPGARALVASGWRPVRSPMLPSPLHASPLEHHSRLRVELHRRLAIPYYTLPYDLVWARRSVQAVADREVHVLAPDDALVHLCAHAMASTPILRWAPDIWFLMERHPTLDWTRFLATVTAGRLALPCTTTLQYLNAAIGLRIPAATLGALDRLSAQARFIERQAARPWAPGEPQTLLAARMSWRQRIAAFWRRAFPSPIQFALRYDLRPLMLPYHYVRRLARFALWRTFEGRRP
jgi:hypothetical protein